MTWNMIDTHMESTKPTSMYVESRCNLSTNVGLGGKKQPTKASANQGAATPWLGHLSITFVLWVSGRSWINPM
jgi:hypothetical protein